MKKQYLFSLLVLVPLILGSCKSGKGDIDPAPDPWPDGGGYRNTTLIIGETIAEVVWDEKTGGEDESVTKQIENEIKTKFPFPAGTVFNFNFSSYRDGMGKLTVSQGNEEREADFLLERKEGIDYLNVQYDENNTEIYLVSSPYLLRDFTEEYKSVGHNIVSALGGYRFAIPR